MQAVDLYEKAWDNVQSCVAAGRLAHAYVVVGAPRGQALQFVESFLQLLYCTAAKKPCGECPSCRRVVGRTHPDALWLEPMSKSRQITVADINTLLHRISQTSFEGGWKAGIIASADCMNAASANKLLKTLEEPPPRTLLLLLTDSPQALLPTILSRCQKIVLETGSEGGRDALWLEPLMALLYDLPPRSGLDATRLASRLKMIFDTVKKEITGSVEEEFSADEEALDETKIGEILNARISARLKEVQSEVFRVLLDWYRDVLLCVVKAEEQHFIFTNEEEALADQAAFHTTASVLQAVDVVESMAQRLNRNIPPLQVFDEAFRKLVR